MDEQDRYPLFAGFQRGSDTSREAAETTDAKTLRRDCLEALRRYGPMTADEIAAALKKSVLSIRPRVTELKRLRKVVITGDKRRNRSGKLAVVVALADN